MLNIVIFGAPGSGKGTYSARIKETFHLEHISTGDVLRAEIKNGTELGKTAKNYIDNGQLIPDELMIGILANVYDNLPADCNGVILDGNYVVTEGYEIPLLRPRRLRRCFRNVARSLPAWFRWK